MNEFLQMKKEVFKCQMYQNYIRIYQEIIGVPLNKPVSNSYAAKQKVARQQRHGKVAFDARETPDEEKSNLCTAWLEIVLGYQKRNGVRNQASR